MELVNSQNDSKQNRVRKKGGGRKKIIELQPDMLKAIDNLGFFIKVCG